MKLEQWNNGMMGVRRKNALITHVAFAMHMRECMQPQSAILNLKSSIYHALSPLLYAPCLISTDNGLRTTDSWLAPLQDLLLHVTRKTKVFSR
jgi:hypothetical protein